MKFTDQRGISRYVKRGHLVIEIDENVAKFQGRKIRDWDTYKKRKFENALFMENAYIKKPIKFYSHG